VIHAFIQARTGSQRFPNKVLKELPKGSGVNVLQRVIRRAKKAETIDKVVVLSPDKICCWIAGDEGVEFSLWSSEKRDVLGEFHHAAYIFKPEVIVRITSDCPCIDPRTIDKVVEEHIQSNWQITNNRHDNMEYCSEIDGLDIEVFDRELLNKANHEAKDPDEREHVTRWAYNNKSVNTVESGWSCKNPEEIKLSIDTPEDYERICKLYKDLGANFTTRDVIGYFEKEE
jgi:spore coat polysaccharide biosynthesis protein SpsF